MEKRRKLRDKDFFKDDKDDMFILSLAGFDKDRIRMEKQKYNRLVKEYFDVCFYKKKFAFCKKKCDNCVYFLDDNIRFIIK